jgi:hypothetical protein
MYILFFIIIFIILIDIHSTTTINDISNKVKSLISSNSNNKISYGRQFYDIAKNNSNNSSYTITKQAHLLRIPKASSSSLSVVARRLVGCNPPGPCCKYPGSPPGSCPSRGLFNCQEDKKLIGCTHHYPKLESLVDTNLMSISIMREPKNRSISAFFYPGIHHNSDCTSDQNTCYKQYTNDKRFKNIAVKMLSGIYAYKDVDTCLKMQDCKNSLDKALTNLDLLHFMGVAEMWELSMLVLHLKTPSFSPLLEEFVIGNFYSDTNNADASARVNNKSEYSDFKKNVHSIYKNELETQNSLDYTLYIQVVTNLCQDLHKLNVWDKYSSIRQYWKDKTPLFVSKCS